MKGRGFGLLGDIFVGVVGGLIGGWLAGSLFHFSNVINGINVASILVAFVGAIIFIVIVRMFQGRARGRGLFHRQLAGNQLFG